MDSWMGVAGIWGNAKGNFKGEDGHGYHKNEAGRRGHPYPAGLWRPSGILHGELEQAHHGGGGVLL